MVRIENNRHMHEITCEVAFLRLFSVFSTFSHKVFQTWFTSTKHGTQHYLVYSIILKWLYSKKIVICLKLRAKLHFWSFFSIFGTFSHKVVQIWFVWHETWHTLQFIICYCVEMVRIENNRHTLEITCEVAFLRLFSIFGIFSHKVVQTWFVWHETLHTTLFGIFYCYEMVRIKKDSHMLEITCYAAFLRFF